MLLYLYIYIYIPYTWVHKTGFPPSVAAARRIRLARDTDLTAILPTDRCRRHSRRVPEPWCAQSSAHARFEDAARHRRRNWGSFGLVPFHLILQQLRDPGGHHRTHSTLAQFMASIYAQMRESRARSYPSADRRSYRFEFEQTARTGRGHNCILGRARDCSKTTNLSQPILRERRRVLRDGQSSRQYPEN